MPDNSISNWFASLAGTSARPSVLVKALGRRDRRRMLRHFLALDDADQLKAAADHTEHDVARKIDLPDIGLDLRIRQHGAEAQQAVGLVQRQEMLQHAPAVALAQRLDQHCGMRAGAGQAGKPVLDRIVTH